VPSRGERAAEIRELDAMDPPDVSLTAVGRRHEQLVLGLRAEQDVGEHRHRALAIGDARREAQPAMELGPVMRSAMAPRASSRLRI
jgi:hypothetical protein